MVVDKGRHEGMAWLLDTGVYQVVVQTLVGASDTKVAASLQVHGQHRLDQGVEKRGMMV